MAMTEITDEELAEIERRSGEALKPHSVIGFVSLASNILEYDVPRLIAEVRLQRKAIGFLKADLEVAQAESASLRAEKERDS